MGKITIILIVIMIALLFSGCIQNPVLPLYPKEMQDLTLFTDDHIKISAGYYKYKDSKKAIILLPMMASDKSSYYSFASKAYDAGYNVMILDMRGHGKSEGSFLLFKNEDFQKMNFDVKAAHEYLKKDILGLEYVSIVGASIGANVSVNYSAKNSGISKIVLLSPGIEYRGVNIENNSKYIDQNVLIIAANADKYSYDSSVSLSKIIKKSEMVTVEGSAHGTSMFTDEMIKYIVDWISKD